MVNKKTSSKIYSLAKSAVSAAVLPVFLIYIMIDKPDYKIMNGLAHVVLPVANWIGDGISWPVRAIGNTATGIRELSKIRSENKLLRIKLDEAIKNQQSCEVAISENQKLNKELDIVNKKPYKTIVADVVHNNKAFHHDTFFINKGTESDIEIGDTVISFDGSLVGIVSEVSNEFGRVRALNDSKSNIPVRVSGTEIYGFLRGQGSDEPKIGFFSDPEFKPYRGLALITSKIGGILPDGIFVGTIASELNVTVSDQSKITRIMVLKFDNKNKYK